MKVLFIIMFVFCSNIVYIYNMYLDVVVIIYYTTIYRGMHVAGGVRGVYIYVDKLKNRDKV